MKTRLAAPSPAIGPGPRPPRARAAGVTLVELLATLAVAAIVSALGVPSFLRLLARHAVAAQAGELQDAVRAGRSEAMKRGGPVVLCRTESSNPGHCAGSAGDWRTWLLFADVGRTGAFKGGDVIVREHLDASSRMTVVGSAASIRFEATGIARADTGDAVFVLSPAGPGAAGDRTSVRRVCVDPRGEVAVTAGGAACP
jgi:type IV fimbrial biogenesis protein FimT